MTSCFVLLLFFSLPLLHYETLSKFLNPSCSLNSFEYNAGLNGTSDSGGCFRLCHSIIMYLFVDRDSFFYSPRKWYGNWAHRIWQETRSWLLCNVMMGRMALETTLCPSILWIISFLSEGKDKESRILQWYYT